MSPLVLLVLVLALGAACGLAGRLRSRRRRREINAAIHEARRPAQLIALHLEQEDGAIEGVRSCLDQLASGLDLIDRTVNGPRPDPLEPVAVERLVGEARARWAWSERIEFAEPDEDPAARVPAGAAAAIDNLLANALEHGKGRVCVAADGDDGSFELTVSDRGARGTEVTAAKGDDPRRGHGSSLVTTVVEREGGEVVRSPAGFPCGFALPMTDPNR